MINLSNIQKQASSLVPSSVNSTMGKIVSWTVTPIKSAFNQTLKAAEKINRSVVGRYLINSSKENILECAGALGGAVLGEWYVDDKMENLGSKIGYLMGLTTALGLGVLSGAVIYHKIKAKKQSNVLKVSKSFITGTTVTILTGLVLPNMTAQAGAVVGRKLGMILGAQGGAILGGYTAIYLYGSEESLVDSQRPINSYVIKTLQSSAVCAMIGNCISFNPVAQAIHDLAVGALAYHSLTVFKPLILDLVHGRLLDEVLFNSPTLNSQEKALIQKGIKNAYQNPTYRQKALALAISQGINQDILNPFFGLNIDQVFQYLRVNQTSKMSEQELIHVGLRVLDRYFTFLQDSEIREAQNTLTQSFFKWQSANSQNKVQFATSLAQAKQNLRDILKTQQLNYLSALPQSQFTQVTELIDNAMQQHLINKWMLRMEKFEENVFAFPLTNDVLKNYVSLLIDTHAECFSQFLAAEILIPLQPIEHSKLVKKTYLQMNKLLAGYYNVALEVRLPMALSIPVKKIVHLIEFIFDSQIQTAKLKDSTLNDFIDIQQTVKSLKN